MLKIFLEILMKFVEKCGEPLYKFLSIFLRKFCTIFMPLFGKTSKKLWKTYAVICIDMDIDTRESIDTYWYFPILISIHTFPITNPCYRSWYFWNKLCYDRICVSAFLNWDVIDKFLTENELLSKTIPMLSKYSRKGNLVIHVSFNRSSLDVLFYYYKVCTSFK